MPFNSTYSRTFDLYQNYVPSYAQAHVLDTSFMVEDDLYSAPSETAKYAFKSSQDQVVHVLVVPVYQIGVFQFKVTDSNGNTVVTANSLAYINFATFTSHAGQTYTVTVSTQSCSGATQYRLFVTGSYEYLNMENFSGSYIHSS